MRDFEKQVTHELAVINRYSTTNVSRIKKINLDHLKQEKIIKAHMNAATLEA